MAWHLPSEKSCWTHGRHTRVAPSPSYLRLDGPLVALFYRRKEAKTLQVFISEEDPGKEDPEYMKDVAEVMSRFTTAAGVMRSVLRALLVGNNLEGDWGQEGRSALAQARTRLLMPPAGAPELWVEPVWGTVTNFFHWQPAQGGAAMLGDWMAAFGLATRIDYAELWRVRGMWG